MKNKLVITALLLALASGGLLFFVSRNHSKTAACRIAIFLPAIHPAMDAIEDGFKHTLNAVAKDCTYITYNAGGNKTLLHAQAEDIVQGNYQLIFTVGTTCSQTIYELCKKKQKITPVIFSAVDNPDKIGIVQSLESSGNNLTGVISDHEHKKQLAYLFKLRPNIKQVLLVYDPAQGATKATEKKELEQIIESYGTQFSEVAIYQPQEIAQKVAPHMSSIDAILILKDHAVVAGVESLIALCNKYGVTLYASDQHSGEKGAALAFDVSEFEYGSRAAHQAYAILKEHKKPADIPIYRIQDQQLHVNRKTMLAQGLPLSDDQLNELQAEGVIII